ncbi:MAG TPA: undecaprenyl-diphosphate phosphatase [Planctomycetota bacterium]|jgi:undecaprenyl-diphosphatase
MEYLLNAAIKGVIEGVTEFLPISSTGHLILVRDFFPLTSDPARTEKLNDLFDIVIQFPAILAIVVLYRQRLWNSARTFFSRQESQHFWITLVLAFLPAAVIGLLVHKHIEEMLMFPKPVACALIVGGIALLLVEKIMGNGSTERAENVSTRTGIAIGFWQCLGMIPGTSRSGATIVGARAHNLTRSAAAEFSFFLALPTMLGAFAFKMFEYRKLIQASDIPVLAVGSITSFVVAAIVVYWFIRFLQTNKSGLMWFGAYRIIVGLVVLYFAMK